MNVSRTRSMEGLSCKEIFEYIRDRQVVALMFHGEMADLFDFLGLNGFKRMHEYQYFSESAEFRGICRYYINHHNKILVSGNLEPIGVIPSEWGQYTRFDVTPQVRRQAVENAFTEYRDWESETKEVYSEAVKRLMELDHVADANKICELVTDVDEELKCLDRLILRLKATAYDPVDIVDMQDSLHEYYKQKTKEIGIDIC